MQFWKVSLFVWLRCVQRSEIIVNPLLQEEGSTGLEDSERQFLHRHKLFHPSSKYLGKQQSM